MPAAQPKAKFRPTIGADPELFLVDDRSGGVVPVCGLIGGEKGSPKPIINKKGDKLKEGFGVQEDNVMVEFNIPPANSSDTFVAHINNAKKAITHMLQDVHPWLRLDDRCTRLFSRDKLESKQAMMFGCSADYDAHMEGRTCPPLHGIDLMCEDGAWRFAGGHIHLGYVRPDTERAAFPIPDHYVALLCDVFLGLPAVSEDKQGLRREQYGKAGRYRPTPYGIEYRTLSNFWVTDTNLCYQIAGQALQLAAMLSRNDALLGKAFNEIPWSSVKEAIENEDVKQSTELLYFLSRDLSLPVGSGSF